MRKAIMVGSVDAAKIAGRDTFIIDWHLMANKPGLALAIVQSVNLTNDNAALQLARWDAAYVIAPRALAYFETMPNNDTALIANFELIHHSGTQVNTGGRFSCVPLTQGDGSPVFTLCFAQQNRPPVPYPCSIGFLCKHFLR